MTDRRGQDRDVHRARGRRHVQVPLQHPQLHARHAHRHLTLRLHPRRAPASGPATRFCRSCSALSRSGDTGAEQGHACLARRSGSGSRCTASPSPARRAMTRKISHVASTSCARGARLRDRGRSRLRPRRHSRHVQPRPASRVRRGRRVRRSAPCTPQPRRAPATGWSRRDGGVFSGGAAVVPRLDRGDRAEQADRRHGRDAVRHGLLAGRVRRRHLLVRRRHVPRLDRRHAR